MRTVARRELPHHPKLIATRADLRAREARDALQGVDVLFHLGAALWRDRSGSEAGLVNIEGTRNVVAARPGHLVFASSAAVYGAWPNNPVPIDESHPPRPNAECPYASHKLAAEHVALESPSTTVLRFAAVLGPNMDPQVARTARGYRLAVPAIRGAQQALQFLMEDDATSALLAAASRRPAEVLNISTRDWLDADALAAAARSRVVRIPRRIALSAPEIGFRMHMAPFGVDRAIFLTGPLALSAKRAATALGWSARLDSRQTIERFLHGPRERSTS